MNRISQFAVALAFVATAAVPVAAQNTPAAQLGIIDGKNIENRIGVMLSHREQLKLTAEQVVGLEQTLKEYQEKNGVLYRQVQQKLSEQPAGSESLAELRERPDLNPLFEQMRGNNHAVFAKLRALLTEEQLELASHYFRNVRAEGRERTTRNPPQTP